LAKADASFAAGPVTAVDEGLRRLQLDSSLADKTLADLNQRHQDAVVNAESSSVELTRLDKAMAPTYPIGPKRYLYLGIGVFCGALVGFVWSHLRAARQRAREEVLSAQTEDAVTNGNRPEREPVPEVANHPVAEPVGALSGSRSSGSPADRTHSNGIIDLTNDERIPPLR
jgi:hypothetical protein